MGDGDGDGALANLPPLREVIRRYGLAARKGLGQHFLLDLNLTRKIARAAGDLAGATVVEIGPGPGGLTRALLETPAHRIVAVERDARCVAALAELAATADDRLQIIEGDALEVSVAGLGPAPRHIVANLPYNVATPLLFRWLDEAHEIASMTLMFQKEVAARLAAGPSSKDYGRLAVMTQWRCTVATLFDLPASAFVPPPAVTSTVVRLVPRAVPLCPADPDMLSRVVAAAFGQRRKMLRASLRGLAGDAAALCTAAGVPPDARAESLSIADFCALARVFGERLNRRAAP